MNFSPKVHPVQDKNKQSKIHQISFLQVLSGTKNLPPELDELQPKSPASSRGKNTKKYEVSSVFKTHKIQLICCRNSCIAAQQSNHFYSK